MGGFCIHPCVIFVSCGWRILLEETKMPYFKITRVIFLFTLVCQKPCVLFNSSRMRTAHLLIVRVLVAATRCQYWGWGYPRSHAIPGHISPGHNHLPLLVTPGSNHWKHTQPPNRMIDTCENITFPQPHWQVITRQHSSRMHSAYLRLTEMRCFERMRII